MWIRTHFVSQSREYTGRNKQNKLELALTKLNGLLTAEHLGQHGNALAFYTIPLPCQPYKICGTTLHKKYL